MAPMTRKRAAAAQAASTPEEPPKAKTKVEPTPKPKSKPKRKSVPKPRISSQRQPFDLTQLPDFIYEQYKDKVTKTQIFLTACQKLGYKRRPPTSVEKWFEYYENRGENSLRSNISEHYQSLVKSIHETFHPSIPDLVRAQLQQTGYDKVLTFKNASDRLNYPAVTDETIMDWFKRYITNDETFNGDDIGKENFELIQKIIHEIIREKNLVFRFYTNKLSQCRFGFKVPYNINDENNKKIVSITDFYHNQTRELKVRNGLLKVPGNSIKFDLLNDSYFLITEKVSIHTPDLSIIQLVNFDFATGRCKVVGEASGTFTLYSIISDPKDPHKFIFISTLHCDTDFFALVGDLKNGRFVDKYTVNVKSKDKFMCHRLIGNQLSGFKSVSEFANGQNVKEFDYWTMDFTRNDDDEEMEPKTLFKFKLETNARLGYPFYSNEYYVWKDDVCFMSLFSNHYHCSLYVFHVDIQKCFPVNFAHGFNIRSVYLRDDDALVCHSHSETYCLPLNKPEKLEYATWSSIKKIQQQKKDNKIYNYALKAMPLNNQFQPFYIKHSYG